MALQAITALSTVTLQAPTSSVTFSGIPIGYRDLILIANAATSSGGAVVFSRLNNDSGSNYFAVFMDADGSGTSSGTTSGNQARVGVSYATPGLTIVTFFDYSQTDKHKTFTSTFSNPANVLGANSIRWASSSVISTLSYYPESTTWTAGSTFSLYGRIA